MTNMPILSQGYVYLSVSLIMAIMGWPIQVDVCCNAQVVLLLTIALIYV